MEVKVSVEGVPRVVCGVTEETTCQEVVVVLAQALGQPGRYMLREKFKDFERWMTPNERLLETLEKYGEQVREVQLTLLHNGPSVLDEMSRTKEVEQQAEDLKRPKRKSLTLMEEAWGWLENLGKGKVYSTARDKESSKRTDKRNRTSFDVSLVDDKDNLGRRSRSKDLQVQIVCIDKQIFELEEKQKAKIAEQESQQRLAEQEMEQIKFWENELKAEEGHEKHLESQFLEMREKAVECKAKLEEYKHKIQGLDFFATQNVVEEDSEMISSRDANQRRSDPAGDVNVNRKFLPTEDFNSPCGLVSPSHLKERRPTGPTELREWWTRCNPLRDYTGSMSEVGPCGHEPGNKCSGSAEVKIPSQQEVPQ
ncbi:putative ras association domain-containing protein 8-like [Scophthalmus maximus]|uniref:Putative ras association domain-containing protein 8-like n=1 Tax=Scophthalmus maximus TaxID=52904 RepID=A0A2U9BYB6_SCOMX|nr:putative ras association domain-containing protein 8-like [Scophthalmus maximus]